MIGASSFLCMGGFANYTSSWRRLTSSGHAVVEVGHVRDRPFDSDCMSGWIQKIYERTNRMFVV